MFLIDWGGSLWTRSFLSHKIKFVQPNAKVIKMAAMKIMFAKY